MCVQDKMARLLRLHKEALKKSWTGLQNEMKTMDIASPRSSCQDLAYMMTIVCTPTDVRQWFKAIFAEWLPKEVDTLDTFLHSYNVYQKHVDVVHLHFRCTDAHFCFLDPCHPCLQSISEHVFLHDFVLHHLVVLYKKCIDGVQNYRRHSHHECGPVTGTLNLIFRLTEKYSSYDVLKVWKTLYLDCFKEAQKDPLMFSSASVIDILLVEHEMCLLFSVQDLFQDITHYFLSDHPISLSFIHDVLEHDVILSSYYSHNKDLFIKVVFEVFQEKCQTDPWDGIAFLYFLNEKCVGNGYDIGPIIRQHLQHNIHKHLSGLIKNFVACAHWKNLIQFLCTHLDSDTLCTFTHCVAKIVWSKRDDVFFFRMVRRLSSSLPTSVAIVVQPIVSEIKDAYDKDTDNYRVYSTATRRFFTNSELEMGIPGTPEKIHRWKNEWMSTYSQKFPTRKITWYDWESTVVLTNGLKMGLPQYILLSAVEHNGMSASSLESLTQRLGWPIKCVYAVVHSLLTHQRPLLERVSRNGTEYERLYDTDIVFIVSGPHQPALYRIPVIPNTQRTLSQNQTSDNENVFSVRAKTLKILKHSSPINEQTCFQKLPEENEDSVKKALQYLVEMEYCCLKNGVYTYIP